MPGSTTPAVPPDIVRCQRLDRRWRRHGQHTWVSRPEASALPETGNLVRALRPYHGRGRTGCTTSQHAALVQNDGRDAADAERLRSGSREARQAARDGEIHRALRRHQPPYGADHHHLHGFTSTATPEKPCERHHKHWLGLLAEIGDAMYRPVETPVE